MKPFSCYLSPFIFLFLSLPLVAQFNGGKYDKEIFLIGTLNDYMGYQRTFTNGNGFSYQKVDDMSTKHALFIDSLFSPRLHRHNTHELWGGWKGDNVFSVIVPPD